MQVRKVIIVGGGSSGWMTAAYMSEVMKDKPGPKIEISLIESENIGKIGVGEATVVSIKYFLKKLGIGEREFLRETDGTFKQSIKFSNWLYDPKEQPHHYYHPFDNPIIEQDLDVASFWVKKMLEGKTQESFADASSVQPAVCEAGLGPKLLTDKDYDAPLNYAYHFDAFKFANYLTGYATKRGVKHIIDDVIDLNFREDGYISAVVTEKNGEIEGDLFIDSTGFAAHLIGKKMEVPFIDFNWTLFCDRAITLRAPYSDPNHKITPYTHATAQDNGWIWDIQLQKRRGVGYVYSGNAISDTQAEETLRAYVGPDAEGIDAQIIPIKVGYRREIWHKNCVAIGLSGGFIEPLESTGIYLIESSIYALADYFPTNGGFEPLSKHFNRLMHAVYDNIISFVKLHYCLTRRTDTEFWRANADPASFTDTLKESLELYPYLSPPKYDPLYPTPFAQPTSFQFILYGMDYQPKAASGHGSYLPEKVAREYFDLVKTRRPQALAGLPSHNDLIRHMTR